MNLGLQRTKKYEDVREDHVNYDPSVDESFQLFAEMVPLNLSALLSYESKLAFGSFAVRMITVLLNTLDIKVGNF